MVNLRQCWKILEDVTVKFVKLVEEVEKGVENMKAKVNNHPTNVGTVPSDNIGMFQDNVNQNFHGGTSYKDQSTDPCSYLLCEAFDNVESCLEEASLSSYRRFCSRLQYCWNTGTATITKVVGV